MSGQIAACRATSVQKDVREPKQDGFNPDRQYHVDRREEVSAEFATDISEPGNFSRTPRGLAYLPASSTPVARCHEFSLRKTS